MVVYSRMIFLFLFLLQSLHCDTSDPEGKAMLVNGYTVHPSPISVFPSITTWDIIFVPFLMVAPLPIIEKGPITTSSSMAAFLSTIAVVCISVALALLGLVFLRTMAVNSASATIFHPPLHSLKTSRHYPLVERGYLEPELVTRHNRFLNLPSL